MPTMTLRGLDENEAQKLRNEAQREGVSLNLLLLRLIRRQAGLVSRPIRHHDLDALAGSWSKEDAVAFENALKETERVDSEMWK